MNEDFTYNSKYNTASDSVQQQNVNFEGSEYFNAQTQYTQQSRPVQPMTNNNAVQNVQYGQSQYTQQSRPVQPMMNNAAQNAQYGQTQYTQQSRPVQPMTNNTAVQNVQYGQSQYTQQSRPVQPMTNSNAVQNAQYGQSQYTQQSRPVQPMMNSNAVQNMPYGKNQYDYGRYSQPMGGYYNYYVPPTPKEVETASLKNDSSRAGKTTLAIFITMFGVAIIIIMIAMFSGSYNMFSVVTDDPYMGFSPMGFYLFEGLCSLLSIFIPCLIIIAASKLPMEELMPFKEIKGKKLAAIVTGGMSVCMLAQIVPSILGINLGIFGIDIFKGLDSESASGVLDVIMATVCTAIIPALVEEFAYRGLVAGIMEKHGKAFAVFTSAFLFGILHGNFVQIPFAFIVGLVLGYVRVKTESMLPSILIHFGNNFFAVLMTEVGEVCPESIGAVVESGVMILFIVAGLIAIAYLAKSDKSFFELNEAPSLLTFKEKIKTFFSAGTIIASTIVLGIASVSLVCMM